MKKFLLLIHVSFLFSSVPAQLGLLVRLTPYARLLIPALNHIRPFYSTPSHPSTCVFTPYNIPTVWKENFENHIKNLTNEEIEKILVQLTHITNASLSLPHHCTLKINYFVKNCLTPTVHSLKKKQKISEEVFKEINDALAAIKTHCNSKKHVPSLKYVFSL